MTTSTVTPEIVQFAQGVRAALADLPADEVDDLTDGLEADLAESLAEDLRRTLPDPAAYAAELRAAAGLPMRSKTAKRAVLSGLVQGWKDTRADIAATIRRNSALAGAADFLVSLRPVWWVLRAWVATWLLAAFFGMERGYWFDGAWWLVLVAFIVVSVLWGRGRRRGKGVPALIAIGNITAIVALVPVIAAAGSWYGNGHDYYGDDYYAEPDTSRGITLEGRSVTNIFAYDAAGRPLNNVQLFDQEGRPLVARLDPVRDECLDGPECIADPDGQTFAPSKIETGASVANVFPLSFIGTVMNGDTGEMSIDPTAIPQPAKAPFIKVPAVQVPEKVAKSND